MQRTIVYFLLTSLLCSGFLCAYSQVHAQSTDGNSETEYIEKATVLQILSQTQKIIPGTNTSSTYQTLLAHVLDGPDANKDVTVQNSYLNLSVGEEFYLSHDVDPLDGIDAYNVSAPYRLPTVLYLVGFFVLVVIIFGGKQGVRGLISLIVSFLAIFYILLPGILHGYSPIALSIGICSFIVIVGSYITHGFNKTTTAAVVGMIVTICVTGAIAYWAVHATQLSGYTSEEATYLNFDTGGTIDFVGLLLGSIMIGLLGILYDAAIGQAIAVEELISAAQHWSQTQVYRRALRMGKEHIGALVNTLAIAYVGVSLPLLLLLHFSNTSLSVTLNQEIFSTEIVRTAVGSIGLVLAVPITTLVAVYILFKWPPAESKKGSGHHH